MKETFNHAPFLGHFTLVYCVASVILALQFTTPSHADTDMGCKQPLYLPNPTCVLLPGGGTCNKWQFSVAPSSCDGYASEFHCYVYTTPATLWLYTKPGTTPEACACSTGGWIPNPNNPHNDNVNQAYNNDTQCYQP
jgi:hypothetical protein